MKSILVKELKNMGVKRYNGKKIELYTFYVLCSIYKELTNKEE